MADFSIDALGSLAGSGTAHTDITVPAGTQLLEVKVGAEYATDDATGVSVDLKVSQDGSVFTEAAETVANVHPAANALGVSEGIVRLGDDPFRLDAPSYIKVLRVSVTNTSATTAANYCIGHIAAAGQL